jgi:hypothetical protein
MRISTSAKTFSTKFEQLRAASLPWLLLFLLLASHYIQPLFLRVDSQEEKDTSNLDVTREENQRVDAEQRKAKQIKKDEKGKQGRKSADHSLSASEMSIS